MSKNDLFSISWSSASPPNTKISPVTSSMRSFDLDTVAPINDGNVFGSHVMSLCFKGTSEDFLGEGRHAQVFVASYVGSEGKTKLCAVKRSFKDEESLKSVLHEIKILRSLVQSQQKHLGVMHPIGVWEEQNGHISAWQGESNHTPSSLLMIMPLYSLGNLQNFRTDHPKFINQKWFLQFAVDLAGAVRHIHSLNILHADIKSGNLLIDSSLRLVLSDFSLSIVLQPFQCITDPLGLGTLEYSAPEMVHPAPSSVSFPSDIFSVGATLGTLLFNREPYSSVRTRTEKVLRVSRGEYWDFHERKRIALLDDSGSSCYSPALAASHVRNLSQRSTSDIFCDSPFAMNSSGVASTHLRRVLSSTRLQAHLGVADVHRLTCRHPNFCFLDTVKEFEEERKQAEVDGNSITPKDGNPMFCFPAGDSVPTWARKVIWKSTLSKAEERWTAGEMWDFLQKQRQV